MTNIAKLQAQKPQKNQEKKSSINMCTRQPPREREREGDRCERDV